MKKLVALIVDDSKLVTDRIMQLLVELENVELVLHAFNFEEGIKMIVEKNPNIAFLDIKLGGKNGIELLKAIKLHKSSIRVVMLTNHATEYYRAACKKLGASDFFDKSTEIEKLKNIVSNFQLN